MVAATYLKNGEFRVGQIDKFFVPLDVKDIEKRQVVGDTVALSPMPLEFRVVALPMTKLGRGG